MSGLRYSLPIGNSVCGGGACDGGAGASARALVVGEVLVLEGVDLVQSRLDYTL